MRSVLVDHARRRVALKRGGGAQHVDLDAIEVAAAQSAERLVALDEALLRLGDEDERLVQVVQLRFFAGQSTEETAAALGISERTVKRDWRLARAILHAMLTDTKSPQEEGL